MLKGMFVTGFAWGLDNFNSAHLFIPGVIMLAAAFYGMLRPGELLNVRARDLAFTLADNSWVCVIAIVRPKNRLFMGRNQFATIREPWVVDYLKWMKLGMQGWETLWPSSRMALVKLLGALLETLGLLSSGITLGSFRPGGTTHYFMSGTPVDAIRFKGRWASEKSMSVYIQEAMSCLILAQGDSDTIERVRRLVADSDFAFLGPPPATPWHETFSRHRQARGHWLTKRRLKKRSTTLALS
jgi:hypothetical protein